ncbi:MAG: hypothetical protein V9G10_09695 [Candidatus Nanopelagicales bacterium]
MTNMIAWEQDADGIVTLTMDDPGPGRQHDERDVPVVVRGRRSSRLLAEKDTITGVVITSGKKTFFAGGDLTLLSQATPADAPALTEQLQSLQEDVPAARDSRQAGRRGHQRCGARRWLGDRAGLSPPRSRWTSRAARSACPR